MKKTSSLETYSYNFYSQGAEPVLEGIRVERVVCRDAVASYRDDYVQLLYFERGHGTLTVNGQEREVGPGNLAKLFPYHIGALRAAQGQRLEYYRCSFPLSVLMYLDVKKRFAETDFLQVEFGDFWVELADADAECAKGALEEMRRECKRKAPHYMTIVLGDLLRALAFFDRHADMQYKKNGPVERSLGWQALQYMHMYFNGGEMDSAALAAKLGIAPPQLARALHRLTGQGFSENLNEVRIRNACAMMFFEELSISFIARSVGYTSLATFHRVFKKMKGITPEQYRNGIVPEATAGAHRDTAWKILVYLLENYAEDMRAASAAEYLFISEDTLAHICRTNFKTSFTGLLEQVRMAYARGFLSLPQLKVHDIALRVGYNSMRTFSRNFKNHTGATPLQYRESACGKPKQITGAKTE